MRKHQSPMPFDNELVEDGDGHQREITIYATQDGVYQVNGRPVIAQAGDPLLIFDGPLEETPLQVLGPFPRDPVSAGQGIRVGSSAD